MSTAATILFVVGVMILYHAVLRPRSRGPWW